jgi:hypothetical protein
MITKIEVDYHFAAQVIGHAYDILKVLKQIKNEKKYKHVRSINRTLFYIGSVEESSILTEDAVDAYASQLVRLYQDLASCVHSAQEFIKCV